MKIGIVGPADRAVAWEQHLRAHRSISEVAIAAKLKEIGSIDACFLLDDSEQRLQHLLESVKSGHHTFLIAPLPTDSKVVEKVYHAAEEANVLLQFSHWPTLAPTSKFMGKKITRPSFIQIIREVTSSDFIEGDHEFDYYWIDELAYCLRWINGSVHHIDLKKVEFSKRVYLMHMLLRFDSGSTANIYVNATAHEASHHRIAADKNYLLDCDVVNQSVRVGEQNESGYLYFKKQSFDASQSAGLAAMEFIKSVQMRRPTIYNGYHLMKLTKTIDKIKNRLTRL